MTTCSHGNTWISASIGNHLPKQSHETRLDLWTYRFAAIERSKIKFIASNMEKSVVVNVVHKNGKMTTTLATTTVYIRVKTTATTAAGGTKECSHSVSASLERSKAPQNHQIPDHTNT